MRREREHHGRSHNFGSSIIAKRSTSVLVLVKNYGKSTWREGFPPQTVSSPLLVPYTLSDVKKVHYGIQLRHSAY